MRTFDFRGKECPEGYVLVTRVLDLLKPGEAAEVLMDSWRCATMIVYTLKDSRRVRFEVNRSGDLIRFTITKL
ncbi:MAG: sulfurtransferase TusA family protein [Acidilobus sp.]